MDVDFIFGMMMTALFFGCPIFFVGWIAWKVIARLIPFRGQ